MRKYGCLITEVMMMVIIDAETVSEASKKAEEMYGYPAICEEVSFGSDGVVDDG